MDAIEEVLILLLTRAMFKDDGYWFSLDDFNEVLGRVQFITQYDGNKEQFTSAAGQ